MEGQIQTDEKPKDQEELSPLKKLYLSIPDDSKCSGDQVRLKEAIRFLEEHRIVSDAKIHEFLKPWITENSRSRHDRIRKDILDTFSLNGVPTVIVFFSNGYKVIPKFPGVPDDKVVEIAKFIAGGSIKWFGNKEIRDKSDDGDSTMTESNDKEPTCNFTIANITSARIFGQKNDQLW